MKKFITSVVMICCCIMMLGNNAKALEPSEVKAGTILQTSEETELWNTPGKTGEILIDIPEGKTVLTEEDCKNTWCHVLYEGTSGYIELNTLEPFIDQEKLDSEFQQVDKQMERQFEEVQLFQAQKKESIIWGSIIFILVAATFGVGLISTIKNNKKENKQQQQ